MVKAEAEGKLLEGLDQKPGQVVEWESQAGGVLL